MKAFAFILVLFCCLIPTSVMSAALYEHRSHTCPDGVTIEAEVNDDGSAFVGGTSYGPPSQGDWYVADWDAICEGEGHGTPTPTPEDPEEPPVAGDASATNVPTLQNFDMTANTYTANELSFTFAPKGNQLFYLHVNLKFENGKDVLSAWCTGDEKVCKAVGNGQACSGTDYTGANAWCYKAN